MTRKLSAIEHAVLFWVVALSLLTGFYVGGVLL